MQTTSGAPERPARGPPRPDDVGRAATPDAQPAATLPSATTAPPEPPRVRERGGSFDSLFNLVRMILVVLFGMVVGAFICAALGL